MTTTDRPGRLRALAAELSAPSRDVWTDRYMADDVLAGLLDTALAAGRRSPGDIAAAHAESWRAGSRLARERLAEAYRLLRQR